MPTDKTRKPTPDAPQGVAHDDEAALFRRAMSDARPLQTTSIEPVRRPVPARARFTRSDERDVLAESLNAATGELEHGSGDSLSFFRPVVGRRTQRRLSRGKFAIQDELDLHGMTVPEAREALQAFIETSALRGLTCVRVIHGKGRGSGHQGPVLKRKVDVWLRQWDPILAFSSARPVDGGTGALYVLLRRD